MTHGPHGIGRGPTSPLYIGSWVILLMVVNNLLEKCRMSELVFWPKFPQYKEWGWQGKVVRDGLDIY